MKIEILSKYSLILPVSQQIVVINLFINIGDNKWRFIKNKNSQFTYFNPHIWLILANTKLLNELLNEYWFSIWFSYWIKLIFIGDNREII